MWHESHLGRICMLRRRPHVEIIGRMRSLTGGTQTSTRRSSACALTAFHIFIFTMPPTPLDVVGEATTQF
jgi:hypothetical protein